MANHSEINKITESTNEYEVWRDNVNDYILDLGWSSKNDKLVVGTSSGTIIIVDTISWRRVSEALAHKTALMSVRVSPIHDLYVTTGQDGFIKLWSFESSKPIAEIRSKSQWVNFAEWSHDGNYFATAEGNTVRIFDSKGNQINCFDIHESTVSGIQWKKDTHQLVTACYGGVRLFEVGNEKQLYFFEWKNSMLSLSWSPDGKFIGCGTQDSRVHFFPLPYEYGSDFEMNGYRGKVKIMDWTADSNYFLTNCWNEIVVWKFAGKSPQGQTPIILDSHLEKVTQATFQTKGSFLASGDELGFVMFYDVEIGGKAVTGVKLKHEVSKLKWANDNRLLAVGTADGELIIMESPI